MKTNGFTRPRRHNFIIFAVQVVCLMFLYMSSLMFAEDLKKTKYSDDIQSDDSYIDQYVKSKGNEIIVFDSNNVKQFWIDNSVHCINKSINIALEHTSKGYFTSIPLLVQLKGVDVTQDCNVEIIADSSEIDFEVLNSKSKSISSPVTKGKFLQYSTVSTSFHLENTSDYCFYCSFFSSKDSSLSIKRIIFSFSKKENFITSSKTITATENNSISYNTQIRFIDTNSFELQGISSSLLSKNRIILSNNCHVYTSATAKNIGNTPLRVYIGFQAFNRDGICLGKLNYPYKESNETIEIVSTNKETNTIIVKKSFEWVQGAYLAVNAKDDLSDIPNTNFLKGKIRDVKLKDDKLSEITLDAPLDKEIKDGSLLRVHVFQGGHLYLDSKTLLPNEELNLDGNISFNKDSYVFSSDAIPHGVHYVSPIIYTFSNDPNQDSTVLINNYTVKISYN